MKLITSILTLLNDRSKSMLIYCGSWRVGWVNDKEGPQFSERTFRLMERSGLIKPLLFRVQRQGEGPWYTISEEGKEFLKAQNQKAS